MTKQRTGVTADPRIRTFGTALAVFMRRASAEQIAEWAAMAQSGDTEGAASLASGVVLAVDQRHARVLREMLGESPSEGEVRAALEAAEADGSDGLNSLLMRHGAMLVLGLMLLRAEEARMIEAPRDASLSDFLREREAVLGPCPPEVMSMADKYRITMGALMEVAGEADRAACGLIESRLS